MPISAECHSDDRVVEVSFDAEPWFRTASDEEICALAACGWLNYYPADVVAISMAESNENVQRMFTYLDLVAGRKNSPGFECSLNEQQAMAWLAEQRPQLHKLIEESRDGFVEAGDQGESTREI